MQLTASRVRDFVSRPQGGRGSVALPCRQLPRSKVAFVSAPTDRKRPVSQNEQRRQLDKDELHLLNLFRTLRTEPDVPREDQAGLVPVWLTAAELQQLLQPAAHSGACVGQASSCEVTWRHTPASRRMVLAPSVHEQEQQVSPSGACMGQASFGFASWHGLAKDNSRKIAMGGSCMTYADPKVAGVDAAGEGVETGQAVEVVPATPQVEDAGFKLWMAGQQQHISFDPLAAQVMPGELEDPRGSSYPPASFSLLDWRAVNRCSYRVPAFEEADTFVAEEDEQSQEADSTEVEVAEGGTAVLTPMAGALQGAIAAASEDAAAQQHVPEQQQVQQEAAPETVQVPVTFKFNCKTQFGQRLWLVGDHPQLGGWDCSKWVKMRWAQGDVWTADVAFEHLEGKATPVAFKAVLELAAGGQKCWTAGEPWQLVLQGRQPIEACHAFKR